MSSPKYPVYIISKGRWDRRLTAITLEELHVPYYMVVEKQEYDKYAQFVTSPNKLIILPPEYLQNYDTCDGLGDSLGKGPGAARNFCWDHSISLGAERHWVMDDNMRHFYRLNRNARIKVGDGTIFKASEDFVDRYENVAIAGLNYRFLCKQVDKIPPYYLNARIYSCLLIQNDIPYRWRGRYNEDTDISLRVLKDGLCTIQFNAFISGKVATQTMSGGNTAEFYAHEGTLHKSEMLVNLHPDVAKLIWRFGRWHHFVDYSPFINNQLIKKPNLTIPKGVNNYGMVLRSINV